MTNEESLKQTLSSAFRALGIEVDPNAIVIEHSKDPAHGDYATNIAMRMAKAA